MVPIHPQYIIDDTGKKISVVLPIKEFKSIMEELEDIKLYDESKADEEPSMPADDAFKLIEANRNYKN
jgi:hypothetical protein